MATHTLRLHLVKLLAWDIGTFIIPLSWAPNLIIALSWAPNLIIPLSWAPNLIIPLSVFVGAEHALSIIQNGLYRYFLIKQLP